MKKILFAISLIAVFFLHGAKAQSINSYNETYTGSAYRILMNGEPKEAQPLVFTLHNGTLTGVLEKFGKMPGSVHFRVTGVSLSVDGRLTTTSPNAGEIRIFGFLTSDLKWDTASGDPLGAFHGTLLTSNGVKTIELHFNVTSSVGFSRKKVKFSFLGSVK